MFHKKFRTFLCSMMSALLAIQCINKEENKFVRSTKYEKDTTNQNVNSGSPAHLIALSSDSTMKGISEAEHKAIVSDEKDFYHLVYKLEIGKKYFLKSTSSNTTSLAIDGESKTSVTEQTTDPIKIEVISYENAIYHLKLHLGFKTIKTSSEGKSVTLDSQAKEPESPELKMPYQIYHLLGKAAFDLKMSENGELLSLTGFDSFYKAVERKFQDKLSKEEMKGFLETLKASVNAPNLLAQLSNLIFRFPETGMKIGQAIETGSEGAKTKVLLEKIDDQTVNISLSSNFKPQTKNQSHEGVSYSSSQSAFQSGNLILDRQTGWILSVKMKHTISEKTTAKKNEISQTIVKKLVSNLSVRSN